jgi:hypothetical protein
MNAQELARIADIIPPSPPPPSYPAIVLLLSALALMLVITITLYWYRHATAAKLWRLRLSCRNAHCTQRELSMQLLSLICHELEIPVLGAFRPHRASLEAQWAQFSTALHSACYSREAPDNKRLHQLIDEARFWIAHRA